MRIVTLGDMMMNGFSWVECINFKRLAPAIYWDAKGNCFVIKKRDVDADT